MNIVDPILYQCRRQPPAAALCVPGTGISLISYRRLENSIHNVSRRLSAFGLPPQSIIAISLDDVILHAIFVLVVMRLGMIALSLRRDDQSSPVKIDALISDALGPSSAVARVILADLSWIEGDGRPLEPHLVPQTGEDDLCRLILTSGTASTPKAVPLSHKLLASRMARHSMFGNRIANCSRIYSDVPISSSLGFQFLIYTLSRGGMAFFPGDDFPSTLRAIENYRVQCMVGSPGGFENLLRWYDAFPFYLSHISVIFCGGDVLSRSLSDRLRSRICSHLIAAYGSTEASMSAIAHAHEIADVPRAVGFVTPGVVVQIVDSSDIVLPPSQEGRIRVRSEFAVDSYLDDPKESEKVFRDGWFYPGDLGTLSADGLLAITGREQSILNLGGDKVSPEFIELVLGQFPGIVEAAAIALPNTYGNNEVYAVLVAGEKIDEQALRAYCEARLPRAFIPVKFVVVGALPRNANGKLDRRGAQELISIPS